MNITIKEIGDTHVSYEDVVELLHDSFQERLQQGLNFTCSSMTTERFIQKTKDAHVLVAINEDTGFLCGTATIHIKTDNEGYTYGYNEYLAIASNLKRLGIGSKLEKYRLSIAKAYNADYILTDTAVGAESSVKYHLKNGFNIISLISYPSTNYYSYIFRKQLIPSLKWDSSLYRKYIYIKSYLRTKLLFNSNGSLTKLGKIVYK